jgi:hypothetical protein
MPRIRGVIERRLLVNYRVDPAALARTALLPAPFRPHLVNGAAIAGICLIRLAEVRPPRFPPQLGFASENAAHRIAVEWDAEGETRTGVFVPYRDTSSRLNACLGGRAFAGLYRHARFQVDEGDGRYCVEMTSDDGSAHVRVAGRVVPELPRGSLFGSMEAASAFFQQGSLGYSPGWRPGEFEALELRCEAWCMEPLAVESVESSLFDNRQLFPTGAIEFDCALLMRNIAHEWHAGETLCPPCTNATPIVA